jgi:hypothetical protein
LLVAGLHVGQVVDLKRAQMRRHHVAHDDLTQVRAANGDHEERCRGCRQRGSEHEALEQGTPVWRACPRTGNALSRVRRPEGAKNRKSTFEISPRMARCRRSCAAQHAQAPT